VGLSHKRNLPIKKKLDELEQKIQETFAAVPLDFLRKGVISLSSRAQKGVQHAGAYVDI
jgi:hypothetical protein